VFNLPPPITELKPVIVLRLPPPKNENSELTQ
jgi:hypothetical protein